MIEFSFASYKFCALQNSCLDDGIYENQRYVSYSGCLEGSAYIPTKTTTVADALLVSIILLWFTQAFLKTIDATSGYYRKNTNVIRMKFSILDVTDCKLGIFF